MRVIDHEPRWWFLLEMHGDLFLNANCEQSCFSFDFMIQLDEEETAAYRREGRDYLSRLAGEIQDSAPVARNTRSRFKGRDVSGACAGQVAGAVSRWRAAGG